MAKNGAEGTEREAPNTHTTQRNLYGVPVDYSYKRLSPGSLQANGQTLPPPGLCPQVMLELQKSWKAPKSMNREVARGMRVPPEGKQEQGRLHA